jgi:hypothetical protein
MALAPATALLAQGKNIMTTRDFLALLPSP